MMVPRATQSVTQSGPLSNILLRTQAGSAKYFSSSLAVPPIVETTPTIWPEGRLGKGRLGREDWGQPLKSKFSS
jgi:hypothetical protein